MEFGLNSFQRLRQLLYDLLISFNQKDLFSCFFSVGHIFSTIQFRVMRLLHLLGCGISAGDTTENKTVRNGATP
jgi:hypothetical protein